MRFCYNVLYIISSIVWLKEISGTVCCRPPELQTPVIKTPEFIPTLKSVSNRQMNTNYSLVDLQKTKGEMLKDYFDTLSPQKKVEFLALREKRAQEYEIYKINPDAWYMNPFLRKGEKIVNLTDVSTQTSEFEWYKIAKRSASKSEIKPKSILISRGEPIYHNKETIPFSPDLNVERDMDYNNWNTYIHVCPKNIENHDVATQGVSTFSTRYTTMSNNRLEQVLKNISKSNDTKLYQVQNYNSINLKLRKNLEFQNVIIDKFNAVGKCFDNANLDLFYMMSENIYTFKILIILTVLFIHLGYLVGLFLLFYFKKFLVWNKI